jgi:hypothetical protein
MSEKPDREPIDTEQEPARQPYTPPQLVRYGTVVDLTRGVVQSLAGDAASLNIP